MQKTGINVNYIHRYSILIEFLCYIGTIYNSYINNQYWRTTYSNIDLLITNAVMLLRRFGDNIYYIISILLLFIDSFTVPAVTGEHCNSQAALNNVAQEDFREQKQTSCIKKQQGLNNNMASAVRPFILKSTEKCTGSVRKHWVKIVKDFDKVTILFK